jgi:uncharacterized Zn ribbon protein
MTDAIDAADDATENSTSIETTDAGLPAVTDPDVDALVAFAGALRAGDRVEIVHDSKTGDGTRTKTGEVVRVAASADDPHSVGLRIDRDDTDGLRSVVRVDDRRRVIAETPRSNYPRLGRVRRLAVVDREADTSDASDDAAAQRPAGEAQAVVTPEEPTTDGGRNVDADDDPIAESTRLATLAFLHRRPRVRPESRTDVTGEPVAEAVGTDATVACDAAGGHGGHPEPEPAPHERRGPTTIGEARERRYDRAAQTRSRHPSR